MKLWAVVTVAVTLGCSKQGAAPPPTPVRCGGSPMMVVVRNLSSGPAELYAVENGLADVWIGSVGVGTDSVPLPAGFNRRLDVRPTRTTAQGSSLMASRDGRRAPVSLIIRCREAG